jgi:propionate CoA-transferase
VLIEIAPGIDLERDILAQMEFQPIIDGNVRLTDASIYLDTKFGLREMIFAKLKEENQNETKK